MSFPFGKPIDAAAHPLLDVRNLVGILATVVVVVTATACALAAQGYWVGLIAMIPSAASAAFAVGLAFGRAVERAYPGARSDSLAPGEEV